MKVFISYSTKDKSVANILYNELRDRTISAWMDRMEIRPGDSLIKKIKEGILSSDALLVLVTKNSVKSKWVQKEVRIASSLQKKDGGPRIIPLVVAPCKVPNNLKDIAYLRIDNKKFKIDKIIEAIYRDSFLLRIVLNRSDLEMNKELLLEQLTDYYHSNYQHIRIYIENHNFNEKVKQVIRKTLSDKDIPPIAVEQIRRFGDFLPVRLPVFWTSLATILEQLIADLIAKDGRTINNLESIARSINSIMDYSLFSLGFDLAAVVFVYNARSIGYEDIAQFIGQRKTDDWIDNVCKRLWVPSRSDFTAIDLVGKQDILNTRVYVPHLSADYYQELQGKGLPVAYSPVGGSRWYYEYLPQIIGREILVWSLRHGMLLQCNDTRVGLHMEDYEKAGLG